MRDTKPVRRIDAPIRSQRDHEALEGDAPWSHDRYDEVDDATQQRRQVSERIGNGRPQATL